MGNITLNITGLSAKGDEFTGCHCSYKAKVNWAVGHADQYFSDVGVHMNPRGPPSKANADLVVRVGPETLHF